MHLLPATAFAACLSLTMALSTTAPASRAPLPERVDYLVIGGGATGMSFCDTLLHHAPSPPSVLMVDEHPRPGGQWHDSYDFVRLHQPSSMYGVESAKLEPEGYEGGEEHRATREEILQYYDEVCRGLEEKHNFRFVGDTSFDMEQLDFIDSEQSDENEEYRRYNLPEECSILARKIVDGRYLQPDLPVHIPPKFQFNPDAIRCMPVNSLASDSHSTTKHYVVIGAGKTGMDAIVHLLQKGVDPEDIVWIVPNDAWITARENTGSCMEFLHDCTTALEKEPSEEKRRAIIQSSEFFQRGFLEWEKQGRAYRLDKDILPTKFKDATLSQSELAFIQRVKRVVRNGRVKSIGDDGTLQFEDGTALLLPWSDAAKATLFVHCSAGAFNYSKHTKKPPPIFSRHRIFIQDVYGTPGFCFVGSIIGKLESMGAELSDAEKNALCLSPSLDASQAQKPLGPSGGDVGVISADHGYVQRLSNLKSWLEVPEIRDWLMGHRLFNLKQSKIGDVQAMVTETWKALEQYQIV